MALRALAAFTAVSAATIALSSSAALAAPVHHSTTARAAEATTEMVADPGFETGASNCFSSVGHVPGKMSSTTKAPLVGARSLSVKLGKSSEVDCAFLPAPTDQAVLSVTGQLSAVSLPGKGKGKAAKAGKAVACLQVTMAYGDLLTSCSKITSSAQNLAASLAIPAGEQPVRVAWTVAAGTKGAKVVLDEAHIVVARAVAG